MFTGTACRHSSVLMTPHRKYLWTLLTLADTPEIGRDTMLISILVMQFSLVHAHNLIGREPYTIKSLVSLGVPPEHHVPWRPL